MNSFFSARKGFFVEFLLIFFTLIVVRGVFVFSVSLNGDDLLFEYSGLDDLLQSHIAQLRAISAFATVIGRFFGGILPFRSTFWNAAQLASMALFSLAMRRFLAPGSPSVFAITLGLLFCLLPFHTDIQLFGIANPTMIFCYSMGALGIAFANNGGKLIFLSGSALALSLGYQTFISIFLSVGLAKSLLLLYDSRFRKCSIYSDVIKPSLRYFAMIAIACFINILLSSAFTKVLSVQISERVSFASPEQLINNAYSSYRNIKRYLFGLDYGASIGSGRIVNILLTLLVIASIGAPFLDKGIGRASKKFTILVCSSFSLLGFLLSIVFTQFPSLILSNVSENPRTLIAASIFPGAISYLGLTSPSLKAKKLTLSIATLIIISFSIISSSIDQANIRSQMRDITMAGAMVERLNLSSSLRPLRTVVFVGDLKHYYPKSSDGAAINKYVHSLFWPWSRLPLLSEVSGQNFEQPSTSDLRIAIDSAAGKPGWPIDGSVFVKDDIGIVILSPLK